MQISPVNALQHNHLFGEKVMRLFVIISIVALFAAGCGKLPEKRAGSVFPLRLVEGRVEAEQNVVRLPSGPSDNWIGIVAAKPEQYVGYTVRFRFKDRNDPAFLLLSRSRGRRVRVTAKDGEGISTIGHILFVSDSKPRFELLEDGPNQAAQSTTPAVTPPAEQEARQP